MTALRAALALLIALAALYVVGMNWAGAFVSWRSRRRGIEAHPSLTPLISLLLAATACSLYPYPPRFWLLLIPLLDIGNWMLLRLLLRAKDESPPVE